MTLGIRRIRPSGSAGTGRAPRSDKDNPSRALCLHHSAHILLRLEPHLTLCRTRPWRVSWIRKKSFAYGTTATSRLCKSSLSRGIVTWVLMRRTSFPPYAFPSETIPYRPPQAVSKSGLSIEIDKITSCEDTFAALSSTGELFTFSLPSPPESSSGTHKSRFNVQPQRVWALRKQFSAVRVRRPALI